MFIDDERLPPEGNWAIVRSSDEAIEYVQDWGVPNFISFDHDLGGTDTSIRFINWLIAQHLDEKLQTFPTEYYVHSQNPVGAENIRSLMDAYISYIRE